MFNTIISNLPHLINAVGPVIAKVATNIVTKLPEIARTIVKIAEVISEVANILGLTDHETPEVIGAKIQQEGTRTRFEDESIEEYLDYLREEIKVDKEKMLNMSEEERIKCTAVGIGALSEYISEKFNVTFYGDFIVDMYKMQMSAKEIASYVKKFENDGISSMDSLSDFLKGKLTDEERVSIYNTITEVEKEQNPQATQTDVNEKIESMKEALEAE